MVIKSDTTIQESPTSSEWSQRKTKRKKNWLPYLFILPTVLLITFWLYKPLLQNLSYTFYDWNMLPGTIPQFVGFENFTTLFSHKDFSIAIYNTLFYIIIMLPFSIIIPLYLANMTQELSKGYRNFYRALLFVPMIVAPVAISIIFQWLLHPTNGLVNNILLQLGLIENGIQFFTNEFWAKFMIALIAGWKMIGFSTLIFSASIGSIDQSYYEAARLDGASKRRMFYTITVPLISPTLMLILTMSILFANEWTFAFIDVLTSGGPYGSSTNLYYIMYDFAFKDMNVGLSAAASLMFLILFGIIAIILQIITKKVTFYDN
ncbi:carbohydrate ABC transporter permease [Metabacillus litoralis]|jgi:multiple sugar transport system permease protein|uniref:carbohydrate ABC transporter permease n=1 Tax=Metabacillus litoralis TaxID=152268 RepID=UPI00203AE1F6|nr:sugar ABC transporter permease [Metabacillus litoralis]MCM3654093.1 sugar ABC transporter permease [Metabacillus litoralis]